MLAGGPAERLVADHEPDRAGPAVTVAGPAGGDVHLLDAQVPGHRAVAAGTGQRGGGFGVGVAQAHRQNFTDVPQDF